MNYRAISLYIFAAMVGVMTLVSLPATANITLTPTIVVIEGRQRYTDISVINTTQYRQTYEMNWKFLKMQEETGAYQNADKSLTDFDLSQNIVFTPRRVTLAPKGVQKVRLGLRLKGEAPPPGDYRAHLGFMNVTNKEAAENGDLSSRDSSVSVSMNLGFTLPVIYRVGDVNGGDATIGNVTTEINPKTNKIEAVVPITRSESPFGTIGTITINYDGKKIGQIRNANIFPEIKNRTFKVPLNIQKLSGGSLEIVYSDFNVDKNNVFDSKKVNIAP